jgi:hypothetical protein
LLVSLLVIMVVNVRKILTASSATVQWADPSASP